MRIRVLIYTHAFAPKIGGVETYVMLLAQGLARRSPQAKGAVRVTVVTPTQAREWNDEALPFRVIRQPGLWRLLRLFWRADVIHLAGPTFVPMLFGLLLKKPVVVEHSLYQAVCPNGLLQDERSKTVCPGHFMARHYRECLQCNAANTSWPKSLTMLLLTFPRRWLCGKVARNVSPTQHVGRRISLARTIIIQHGVAPYDISQRSAGERVSLPVRFAFVGRLVSEKGLHLLIEAARRLHAAGFVFLLKIIGDGPERASLEEAVDALKLRKCVTFSGFLSGDELERALADVAALVMPSIWEETAGLSAMEQMMRGRVVIGTDVGGLGEIVADGGLKFALGDVEGLASCMKQVLDQPRLVQELGKKARERSLQFFQEERMVAEHLAVYREILPPQRRSKVIE